MGKEYDLYGEFDIEQHKAHYVNYLEVMILKDGTVEYAVPSHQIKAEKIAANELGISIQELRCICPPEYHFDYLNWLLNISGAVAVWYNGCIYNRVTQKQIAMLRRLKMAGVYSGLVPSIEEAVNENKEIPENY